MICDSDVHLLVLLWSLQEPTKSAKSSTKNSNAGGGKDAGTENSEEVKMTVLKTYLILCLTIGLPSGLGTNTCSWAFSFLGARLNFVAFLRGCVHHA